MSAFVISAIEGNRQWLDGGSMFGNAPRPVWEKWIAPDSKSRIPLACRSLLIEIGNKKILCETGIGAFFDPKMADRFGVENPNEHILLQSLEKHGVKPEQIDEVILSHLHFDHAGGLLPTFSQMQAGQTNLVFPNARVWVGKEAWDRAEHPHSRDKASFIPGLNEKLRNSGRLVIIAQNSEIPAEYRDRIEVLFTNGHTPGQMHTLFKGNERPVFFCGDLVPGAPWVHLPITMGYDRYPEMVIDEKETVYSRAINENWLLFFTHDPVHECADIRRSANGRFEPVPLSDHLNHRPI